MADYIDREKIRKKVVNTGQYFKWSYQNNESRALRKLVAYIVDKIDETPTEDVVPVIHGKWIENEIFWCRERRIHYDCSRCNRLGFTSSTELKPQEMYKYCPNCGAKMI